MCSSDLGHVWTGEIVTDHRSMIEQPRPWPRLWHELKLLHRITPCGGDTRALDTWKSPRYLTRSGLVNPAGPPLPSQLDVLFLDSDHVASVVIAEWQLLGPRLRHGGLILFHDTKVYSEVATAVGAIASEVGAASFELNSCRGLTGIRIP